VNLEAEMNVTKTIIEEAQKAGQVIGKQIEILDAKDNRGIDAAFARAAKTRADAVLTTASNLFGSRRTQIATLAAHYRMPTMDYQRAYPELGGLVSYGPSFTEQARLVGVYVGRILKGEKPADLPVVQASKFELVINLQTARTLGIEFPPTLLALADEVIE
jgi:putative ABC transport system substrate-binding protein